MRIPFSPPYIDQDVIKEVTETLNSGWVTTGSKTRALESEIEKYVGSPKALCCNSATSALMLALKWFGVKKGDEVIVPAYTYSATALAVLHTGATPVMVDTKNDFNLDVDQISPVITEKTKAIISVDIGGWPCDYQEIFSLLSSDEVKNKFKPESDNQKKLGRLMVLADAAHAIGAEYNGSKVGSLGDIAIFSFHAVKNITTAEGGCLCLNLPEPFDNQETYDQLRLWTLNGQTKDAFSKTNLNSWKYDIIFPGFKINMPDLCAAMGLAQIRKYDNLLLPSRRKVFEFYNDSFSKYPWAELPFLSDETKRSACHLYPLRIKGIDESVRDRLIEKIMDQGVSVNVHFIPLPMLSLFRGLGYKIEDYPNAYDNYAREISLPIYPQLSLNDAGAVVQSVVNSYEKVVQDNQTLV